MPPRYAWSCRVEGCDRPGPYTKGLCNAHYSRLRKYGTPHAEVKPRTKNIGLTCSVDGCPNEASRRQMCSKHYQRWITHGTTADPVPFVPNPCTAEGCNRDAFCKGYCSVHYQRMARPLCTIEGCHRRRVRRGLCEPHYYRIKATGNPHVDRVKPAGIPCGFCNHPDRVTFEAMLLSGKASYADVSRRFDFELGTFWHHVKFHMTSTPRPPRCSVCRHAEVDEIDLALAEWKDGRYAGNVSLAGIARKYGISVGKLRYHKVNDHIEKRMLYSAKRLLAVQEWSA